MNCLKPIIFQLLISLLSPCSEAKSHMHAREQKLYDSNIYQDIRTGVAQIQHNTPNLYKFKVKKKSIFFFKYNIFSSNKLESYFFSFPNLYWILKTYFKNSLQFSINVFQKKNANNIFFFIYNHVLFRNVKNKN